MSTHLAAVRIARLTPDGRGALAVVGVAGPSALEDVARLFAPRGAVSLAERPDGSIVFGRWGDPERGEELVVVRHSTERLEVHCHGGLAASAAVIGSLEHLGAVRQAWPEWLAAAGASAVEVEAREALCRAGGPKAAQILARQLAGALDGELARIATLESRGDVAGAAAARDRLRRAARVGLRLARPWRVVVAGEVNAGKSSLVNALAGHARSIVSPEPGTTRDVLEIRIVLEGWEIDLIDTAGLRGEPAGPTEAAGIERALAAAESADLVLECRTAVPAVLSGLDTEQAGCLSYNARPGGPGSCQRADARQGMVGRMPSHPVNTDRRDACPTILIITKCDLASDAGHAPPDAIRTSVVTGLGIDVLAAAIIRRLVSEEQDDPGLLAGPVPFTARQVALLA